MTEPRPDTKCRRCGEPYWHHSIDGDRCVDGRTFLRTMPRRGASQSFSVAEIDVLDVLVTRALKMGGSDPGLVTLRRKIDVMKRSAVAEPAREAKAS